VTAFLGSRISWFRRTACGNDAAEVSHELKPLPRGIKQSELDTIDKMMMQFKTSEHTIDTRFEERQDSKTSQV